MCFIRNCKAQTITRSGNSLCWVTIAVISQELFFVALLIRFGCPTHLIVLRFVEPFFEHLRGLASSLGIFIFTERFWCLMSSPARHRIPSFRFRRGFEVLFPWIDFLFPGPLAFGLLIVVLGRFQTIPIDPG